MLDTGSSDLWVASTECNDADCRAVPRYSPAASHTLRVSGKPFQLDYVRGSVTGTVGTETITLQLISQTFAVAKHTNELYLNHTNSSGVLGLSFPSVAAIPSKWGVTVLQTLFGQLSESHRFFAFNLGRVSPLPDLSRHPSFTVGDLDPSVTNDTSQMSFFPVFRSYDTPYDFWKVPIYAITLNSFTLPLSPSRVPGAKYPIGLLDTGTTFMIGPSADVEAFWNAVGTGDSVRYNAEVQLWQVRCNRAVDVRVKLSKGRDATEFAIHPADISWDGDSQLHDWCDGGLQAGDAMSSSDWILGDTFLRNVYALHHGATSKSGPVIGLLNLTDPQLAMSDFLISRGPDPAPPPGVPVVHYSSRQKLEDYLLIALICAAAGLIVAICL
ncbi:hypothetical protein ID866_4528, partial [Astraeus odoratus]